MLAGGGLVDGVFEPAATGTTTRVPRPAWTAGSGDSWARSATPSPDAGPPRPGDDVGSNSWVVSGDNSSTVRRCCQRPHLAPRSPGSGRRSGCTAPTSAPTARWTSPASASRGARRRDRHNADIAWGFTNLGPDVTDLFLEQADEETCLYDGERLPLRTREETIEVLNGEDVELRVRSTDNGPILSDVSEQLRGVGEEAVVPGESPGLDTDGYAVSLAWTALEPAPTADALLGLNLASDWEEFRAAAADFAVPAQNLVYADREGRIGYQAPGRVPIRRSGNDGSQPTAGWLPQNSWTGETVPFESLPTELDPAEGSS